MPLRIVHSYDELLVETVAAAIYSQPGLGKSTLMFTAEDVLALDCDEGAHRAKNRGDIVRVTQWSQIAMPQASDFAGYKTLGIDTAGRLLDKLGEQLIKESPKNATPAGGLSLQGFGEMKVVFAKWLKRVRSYGLDVVMVTHMTEERKGDDVLERLDVQGASRGEIHKSADLMGRMFMENGKRIVSFSPTDAAFGKNPANLAAMEVPDPDIDPRFLGKIIAQTKAHLNAQSEAMRKQRGLIDEAKKRFNDFPDAEAFTAEANDMTAKNADRALKAALLNVAVERGFVFDREKKLFVKAPVAAPPPAEQTQQTQAPLPSETEAPKRRGAGRGRRRVS